MPIFNSSNGTAVIGANVINCNTGSHNSNETNLSANFAVSPGNGVVSSGRIHSPPITTPAVRVLKEVAIRPTDQVDSATNIGSTANGLNINGDANSIQQRTDNNENFINSVRNNLNSNQSTIKVSNVMTMIPERDTGPRQAEPIPQNFTATPQRAIPGPTKLTIQSTLMKAQPPMVSSSLTSQNKPVNYRSDRFPNHRNKTTNSLETANQNNSTPSQNTLNSNQDPKNPIVMRIHHHGGVHEFRALQRAQDCHSSSDENRSSGHASMSDTGHGSSSPSNGNRNNAALGPLPEDRLAAGVTNRSTRSRTIAGHTRSRHRATPAKVPWNGNGLEDLKVSIQQLTLRSQASTSTYSSLSAGSESSEPARRLARYSSLETVNTNVTNADEFVWIDSHNRLVELHNPPWTQNCILRVIRNGRCREQSDRVTLETIPRLSYLLQRGLVRIAREVQRLSIGLGLCSKHEVASAFKIVLCPALADSCIKACLRAAAMFSVPGDSALRHSMSSRAGLQLSVGKFHRWMTDIRLGRFVHEYAAVYLCAGLENLLEEIILQSMPSDLTLSLTATGMEHIIANNGDFWGLLQPYAHLNAGRIASGALTMPRWTAQSVGSNNNISSNMTVEPCLLTTCVGSVPELRDLTFQAQSKLHNTTLTHSALITLFYFMRCSQLEHSESKCNFFMIQLGYLIVVHYLLICFFFIDGANAGNGSIQELCYERAYVVLPPLVEWLRVASAHAEYRYSALIDNDDIMQAARLLLPGVDCPPRSVAMEEGLPLNKNINCGKSPASPVQQPNTSIITNPNLNVNIIIVLNSISDIYNNLFFRAWTTMNMDEVLQ